MRLTQLKLSGFKSFVEPTSIHVPGQLVGIVGPNGCGKSNVIDAVRWVLGETRASALRGDSMMDVIFNGSVNRKPLARASVELMFDNSLGRAAGQWSQYAEVSVKRVLQRDGESSYYINNTHVRRRDITDMFLGTGLGPRAYAIIEQGMISRVIEAKPEELRVFLEEAAGISRYKERRRETENRLSDTRDNLSRVTDIRTELGVQIEKLEKQAAVASRYNEFQAELQLKQQLLWFLRRRDAAAERERHSQDIARSSNELEAETARLREIESRIETARSAHYSAGDGMNAAQAALYGANTEVARHESELRHVEESRQRLENRHVELRAQLGSWREQRSQLTQALHMWASRQGGANQRVDASRADLEARTARLPQAERDFRQAQDRLNEARSQLMQAESRYQLEQTNLGHVAKALQTLDERGARLQSELSALESPDPEGLDVLTEEASRLSETLEFERSRFASLESLVAQRELERGEAQASLLALEREHANLAARLNALRQIQSKIEENGKIHAWLARHSLDTLPRVWEKLRISQGWETAFEAILREKLHALELTQPGLLETLLNDAPPAKAVTYSQGAATERRCVEGFTPLLDLVEASEPALAGALADWLVDIHATDGVPSIEVRASLPAGCMLVNRQGHQFTRHSVSFHAPDAEDNGMLARQREIEGLAADNDVLENRVSDARSLLAIREAALSEASAEIAGAREGLASIQEQAHQVEVDSLMLSQKLAQFRERQDKLGAELAEIAAQREAEAGRRLEIEASGEQVRTSILELQAQLDEAKVAHSYSETALADQRREVQQAEREAQEALFAQRECVSKIAEIDSSVRVVDQQIDRADLDIAKLTEELAVDPIPEVRGRLDAAVEIRMGCEKTLAEARATVEAAAAALRETEEERLQTESKINPLRERIGELRLKEQAASINHEQFASQLMEANADETVLSAQAESAPRPSALQGEITRLNQAISELGAVNLAALEELKTSAERKGYLDAQSADLEEAVQTLEDAIRRIDKETRELLRETFESVNRHFGTLFPMLFGGGEAKLTMTGEEILDAGVQVMAQPPGKRNSSIHLLSGGEKALTAISLVFSLFQLNPAPFCLLDEVDAPLDDSNTQRFCDLVKKMSGQTQFLYISHNKITMEMASQLVGVTMQESGVSRVVAVDIDQALRMREELAA